MPTEAATEEFNRLFAETTVTDRHPEDTSDRDDAHRDREDRHSEDEHRTTSNRNAIRSSNFRDSDSDSGDNDTATSRNNNMRSRYFVPSARSEANTGPKGVIADAQAYEEAKRAHRTSFFSRHSRSKSRTEPQHQPTYTIPAAYSQDDYRDRSSGSEASDDEEGFLARWRQGRLVEMQGQSAGNSEKRRVSPSNNRRIWGSLVTVDAEGYLDAIEKVGRDVVVCVLIYDDRSEVSQLIEDCIRSLAHQHTTTRFIKLHYEEAEMEIAGVPALLAYRGGDKFAGLVPIVDEIPDDEDLSPKSLGNVLKRHGILSSSSI